MMRNDSVVRHAGAVIGMLALTAGGASAQLRPSEPPATELRGALRAFYFGLAHHDWQSLAAGILPAKVVAHHQPPASVVAASQPQWRPEACAPTVEERVRDAAITIDRDWAAASVPRCGAGESGADGFRFIHFDGRWWIVYIDLLEASVPFQMAR
jgi:hypothetical protein